MADKKTKLYISQMVQNSIKIEKLLTNSKKCAKEKRTRGFLDSRMEALHEYWTNYAKTYDTLSELIGAETLESEYKFDLEKSFEQTEECYLELLSWLKDKLYELKPVDVVTADSGTHSGLSKIRPKLPPISIPQFSGDYDQWMSFRDLFRSLIHDNSSLTKIEKHHYLKSSLSGEAEQLLKNYSLTEANYDDAWSKLNNRYENKRVIVTNILSRFLSQKTLTSESAKGIKDLLDTSSQCLTSLTNLNIDSWNAIIVHILVSKLDIESRKLWEQSLDNSTSIPTYEDLISFLEKRFRAMEMVNIAQHPQRNTVKLIQPVPKVTTVKTFTTEVESTCTYCSQNHYICHCKDFASLHVPERQDFIKKNNICFNCLVKGHSVFNCRQSTVCKKCGRRHHTLLHLIPSKNDNSVSSDKEKETSNGISTVPKTSCNISVNLKAETKDDLVILATAVINVESKNSGTYALRALVDQGSQGSFISESAAQLLNLKRTPVSGKISGISNSSVVTTKSMVSLTVHSTKDHASTFKVNAYVLKKLTSLLPSREFSQDTWPSSMQLDLADPNFHKPGSIDVLLGADVHAYILLEGLHKCNSLIALNSRLGWLISGRVSQTDSSHEHNMVVMETTIETDQLLRQFWEIEESLPHKKPMTDLEKQCEEHFKNTHTRNDVGRYVVRLPFKDNPPTNLGDARLLAISRLHNMEKRFTSKPDFKEEYHKFLKQYESQGHMMMVPETELITQKVYYLPHHAVLRPTSLSTKLRVVFDGSSAPEKGKSLNDELLTGHPLQQDIRDLITRWRQHKICLVADIRQMYRQILIAKEDVDFQRIVWRESSTQSINEYRLLTVTYGTSCAPFLAIRTLHQLAEDEKNDFPTESEILKNDVYMDDFLTGASTTESAVTLQRRLTELLARGGFPLHKWSSNSKVVLSQISNSDKNSQSVVNIKVEDTIKTLGITWNSETDNFELGLKLNYCHVNTVTKRNVLSTIGKSFDPLGWLTPSIILLKIFMQKLWLAGLGWDEELPTSLKEEWIDYVNRFKHIETIQFPRWFGTSDDTIRRELHGFSDASCAAYAGVVYLRVLRDDGSINVYLVIAKSKVAPVKQVSLPRLELCGAVLLAKMIHHVKVVLNIPDNNVYTWTDSTIVLSWLRKTPNTWTTFVANRTSEILTLTNSNQWHHISSINNPADLASRGCYPYDLQQAKLWWSGPQFLYDSIDFKLSSVDIPLTDVEMKRTMNILNNVNLIDNDDVISYLNRFSTLSKLIRVTAYCCRYFKVSKAKISRKPFTKPVYLTVDELDDALNRCIKMSQSISFRDEIHCLSSGKQVHRSSKIYVLYPFIDDTGIIRVGGRLAHADIPNEMKNPVLLSNNCALSKLIVLNGHLKCLHGGHQLTLNVIRQKFWIIRVKNLVKSVIHKCIPCFKQKANPLAPFMANLPKFRIKPSRPFTTSGVDFCGPFTMKAYPGRCKKFCKSYICLFVCTVTKAIHLELVTDLTSAAFIAAFRRFTARRGHCKEIWSDHGTNFVGASRELDQAFKDSKSQTVAEISELLANDHTQWKFIPPRAPHFGGIWESGVKSIKGHLKRVIGQACLTYEELATLIYQVEACVNSRPLTLMNSTLDETPLTPSHFLIGEPLVGVPEPSLLDVKLSPLNRWHIIQRMVQCLWRRWQNEYLTTLQHRYKWNTSQPDLPVGTVVLVKDDMIPPGKWLLGRVIQKHPGKDGITRVVTLKYKDSVFKRPIVKLCPLPLDVPDSQ